jgi:ABC-2 type transport system ATP-binding protein
MSVIQISNLVKNFGKFPALSGVNLTVEQGEVHAFLGPNGAGKSTTIRCLLGILRATSGTVKMFGQDAWTDAVSLHKRLAYVPGDVNLWDNLTGGEVIDLFLSMRGEKPGGARGNPRNPGNAHSNTSGKPDNARHDTTHHDTLRRDSTPDTFPHNPDPSRTPSRRDKYLALYELDPSKKCRTYSKGNRQKVALVAAFASDAELFVFDEPTSGLDPLLEKVFQDCVGELKKEGKTVLLSSHIMSEVEKLADSVSIIKEGRIVLDGTMGEILQKGTTLEELFLSEYEGRA